MAVDQYQQVRATMGEHGWRRTSRRLLSSTLPGWHDARWRFSSLPLDYFASGIKFFYARKAWTRRAPSFMSSSERPHRRRLGPPARGTAATGRCGAAAAGCRGNRTATRKTSPGYGGSGSVDAMNGPAHNVVLINPDSQGCTAGSSCVESGGGVTYEELQRDAQGDATGDSARLCLRRH